MGIACKGSMIENKTTDRPILAGFSEDAQENMRKLGLTPEKFAQWVQAEENAPEPGPYLSKTDLAERSLGQKPHPQKTRKARNAMPIKSSSNS